MDQGSWALDFLLAQIGRLHHQRVHQLLDVLGLHRGQSRLMHCLWKQDAQSHSELARGMGVTRATITHIVQRAEKAGLVEHRRDVDDQRVSRVYLTDVGWDKRDKVFGAYSRLEAEAFDGFDEQEREQVKGYLERVRGNLKKVAYREQ